MVKTLMQRLLDAGYPKEDMHFHASDLYVFVTPLTTRVIQEYCAENGYNIQHHFPTFKDQVTSKRMYDCAFQYDKEEYTNV